MHEDNQELSDPKIGVDVWKDIELVGKVSDADPNLPEFEYIVEDWTGIELEDTISRATISNPFNPAEIRVDTRMMSIDVLLKRIELNKLDLQPGFQRRDGIWTKGVQSRLIESLLIRIPLPAFYVDAANNGIWLVVDGLQRLTTLKNFVLDNTLKLCELEFLPSLEGKTYADLPRYYQRSINETQVIVYVIEHVIEQGTPSDLKFNIFKRINTGGLPLSSQEIRNALYQGQASETLNELASSAEFKKVVGNSIRDDRMADRECVLRFCALMIGVRNQPMTENQPASPNGIERPTTVFLSYAHEDAEFVKDLQLRLNVRGIYCWRDADDLLPGSVFEHEIVYAIEHEVDALALYITPDFLKSDFIWQIEVPAALRRHKLDPQFHIVPILQGVSFSEVQQSCRDWNLEDLSRFNGISLTDGAADATWKVENDRRNDAARRILQAAMTLRLRRIKADRNYEPWISLKTFFFKPLTTCLDLDLNWLELIREKERLSTLQEWEQILLPALLDVKQVISEKIPSRRVHLFIQSILPVAVALGFTFRESARFTLLLERPQKAEIWSTDEQPSEKELLHGEFDKNDQGDPQVAVVGVATTRSIKQSVKEALPILGLTPGYHIQLKLPELSRDSVKDAAHALAIARQVGSVCQDLCDRQRVAHIHLFAAIPAELAVLIGHQLNALCPIAIYEFDRGYKLVGCIQ